MSTMSTGSSTTSGTFGGFSGALPGSQIIREFRAAWSGLSRDDLASAGKATVMQFVSGTGRRVKHLGRLAWNVTKQAGSEVKGIAQATGEGRLKAHLVSRKDAAVMAGRDLAGTVYCTAADIAQLGPAMFVRPVQAIPEFAGKLGGFLTGSGGIDGDGGIPDLDLRLGIGAHRSFLTHSVLAGAAAESLICGSVILSAAFYKRLPPEHHPFWDHSMVMMHRFSQHFRRGIDAGIGYHLLVDATLDWPAPYKDLPFSMPVEGHQALFGANAAGQVMAAAEPLDEQKRPPDGK